MPPRFAKLSNISLVSSSSRRILDPLDTIRLEAHNKHIRIEGLMICCHYHDSPNFCLLKAMIRHEFAARTTRSSSCFWRRMARISDTSIMLSYQDSGFQEETFIPKCYSIQGWRTHRICFTSLVVPYHVSRSREHVSGRMWVTSADLNYIPRLCFLIEHHSHARILVKNLYDGDQSGLTKRKYCYKLTFQIPGAKSPALSGCNMIICSFSYFHQTFV